MDFLKKIQAIELRKNGRSYTEIRDSVRVSKSTLSNWLREIELTEGQKIRLNKKQATAYIGAEKRHANGLKHHSVIREFAEKEAILLAKDPFFVAGLMLYWAEGGKNFGSVQFSNSDPAMIKIMMKWFRQFCSVPEEKFRIGLFLHSLHVREDCLSFWQEITSIPAEQFQKPFIKPTILSNRKNKLYEGTCMIKIHSRDLLSRILGWKSGVEKIFLEKA